MRGKTSTRERLVAAATDLFSTKGFGQSGVSEIIERAGATSGSFYHFFPAKDDLLVAVVDDEAARIQSHVFDASAVTSDSALSTILRLCDYYRAALLESDFRSAAPTVLLASEVSVSHPEARARLKANHEAQVDQMAKCLEGSGPFRAGFDRVGFARMILASIEGAVLQARTTRSIVSFDQIVDQVKVLVEVFNGKGLDRLSRPATSSRAGSSSDWKAW